MILGDSELPDYLQQMVNEFDQYQKDKYPLWVGSYREEALKPMVKERLTGLGIARTSQYFLVAVDLSLSFGGKSPSLLDPIEYNGELAMMNNVAKINWNIAPGFIVIASDELGGFFLCNETGQIYDAAHFDADKLGDPSIKPVFACFYDLLEWYVRPDLGDDWREYVDKRDGFARDWG
jgi:hypothetical protein